MLPCRPNPEYAPWYGVPLKSARVAVALINMLQQESRASRLSFADIVKRLGEVPPGSHTFISKRVGAWLNSYLLRIVLHQMAVVCGH